MDGSDTAGRTLTETERSILLRFADHLEGEAKARLVEDIGLATVSKTNDHETIVQFDLQGYERPPYKGQSDYGFSALVVDIDMAEILIDLFRDQNGRLLELEFFRGDGTPIVSPRWGEMRVPFSQVLGAKPYCGGITARMKAWLLRTTGRWTGR